MARRRVKGRGGVADALQVAIRREAGKAVNAMERDIEELYAMIGSQLAAIQGALKATRVRAVRAGKRELIIQSIPIIAIPPRDEGKSFVESCWSKLVDRACEWWAENREKLSGKDAKIMIRGLAPIIAPAIPAKFRAGSVVTLTAALLLRKGLDEICQEMAKQESGISQESVEQ